MPLGNLQLNQNLKLPQQQGGFQQPQTGSIGSGVASALSYLGGAASQNSQGSSLQSVGNIGKYTPQTAMLPGLGGGAVPKPVVNVQQKTSPPVQLGSSNVTPMGASNTQPFNDSFSANPAGQPQYNVNNVVEPAPSLPGDLGGGGGANNVSSQLSSLFGAGNNNPYLKSQVDALTRLASLQGQLAQSQVPSGAEMGLTNQINGLTNTIQNTNPQQLYKDNPAYANNGITEGQLERETQQQTLPMTQALSNLVLSKSVLAQQRQITGNQLGAEATGLSNQATIADQIRQATMFGGLPPELANTVLQRTLFPQYSITNDISGRPIAVNPYNPSDYQYVGSGGAGGNDFGNSGTGGSVDTSGNSMNVGGISLPLEHISDGTPYINASRLSEPQQKIAQLAQSQTGVPVLQEGDVSALHTIEEAEQYLPVFEQTAQQLLSPGFLGRLKGLSTNQLQQWTQTNPQWRQFQTLRAGLIKSVQGIAAGAPGLRVTGAELENAAEALPNSTDNIESAQQAIQTFQQLLGVNKQVLLGSTGRSSGGMSGGQDTFGNAAAWQ